jgi:hypothetical protein
MKLDLNLGLNSPGASVSGAAPQPEAVTVPGPDATASEQPTAAATEQTLEAPPTPLKKNAPAGALDPAALAYMNSAIRESVSAIVREMIPAFQKLAEPSPLEQEQIENLARTKERMVREKKQMMESEKEQLETLHQKQLHCSHRDKNEKSSLGIIRNFFDRMPRGICPQCFLLITPREYRVASPSVRTLAQAATFIAYIEKTEGIKGITAYEDPKTHVVTHLLYPEHPLYHRVREQCAQEGIV